MLKKFITYVHENIIKIRDSDAGMILMILPTIAILFISFMIGFVTLGNMKMTPDIFDVMYELVLFPTKTLISFYTLFFIMFLTQQLVWFIITSIVNKLINRE